MSGSRFNPCLILISPSFNLGLIHTVLNWIQCAEWKNSRGETLKTLQKHRLKPPRVNWASSKTGIVILQLESKLHVRNYRKQWTLGDMFPVI